MDVLIDDEVPGEPGEVVPVAELVLQFALARQPLQARARVAEPVARHRGDLAHRALLNPLHGLYVGRLMMPLQADADLQVLLFRLRRSGEHGAHARRVDRERFLDEDMLPLPHRLREVIRMKALRRRDEDEVRERNGLLVCVEADELIRRRDIDLIRMLPFSA